jgi:anhydro-N-acetylmuramic acid kinase
MKITALGIMSGTSLDGIDLALCCFDYSDKWNYRIIDAQTIPYPKDWIDKLTKAPLLKAEDILLLNNEYGRYTGSLVNEFLLQKITPDLICSHGHTIFHQPEKMFTYQLGNGASIAAVTGITTICDFRNLDVALGGQGAPLVPIGDKLLFQEYTFCINLGGFANISYDLGNQRIAFDICPVNIVLNELAEKKNLSFDKDGEIGKAGKLNEELLKLLNSLSYYHQEWPKSLGREWVEKNIMTLMSNSGLSIEDQAATYYEHISDQISRTVNTPGKILFTGGGTMNKFLLSKVRAKTKCEIIVPGENLISYKEALIFAFLGALNYTGRINCLSSVTGARHDSIAGTIFPASGYSGLKF